MTHALVLAAVVGLALAPAAASAQLQEAESELRICNKSSKDKIRTAFVTLIPGRVLLGIKYPWHGEGWYSVDPGRCKTIVTVPSTSHTLWLRIEVNRRVITGSGDGRLLHPADEKFCFNPEKSFSWQQNDKAGASSDCKYGTHAGLFNFFLRFVTPTRYTVDINPDELGRGPVEEFGLTPSRSDVKQQVTDMLPSDLAGQSLWPVFREAIQKANRANPEPRLLRCTYFGGVYSFWYRAPPGNLDEFIRIDARNGHTLSGMGLDGRDSCPPTEDEAKRVRSSNTKRWVEASQAGAGSGGTAVPPAASPAMPLRPEQQNKTPEQQHHGRVAQGEREAVQQQAQSPFEAPSPAQFQAQHERAEAQLQAQREAAAARQQAQLDAHRQRQCAGIDAQIERLRSQMAAMPAVHAARREPQLQAMQRSRAQRCEATQP